jgi:anti-sigma factor RsiW
MSCQDYSAALAEYVDGTLDPTRQRELERHVEGCSACRALLADLKSIQAAAFTLDRIELPPHILPALKARIAEEPLPVARGQLLAFPESRGARAAWAAAAAALLVLTTAGLFSLMRPAAPVDRHAEEQTTPSPAPADGADTAAFAQAEFQAAAEHYERAIQLLEKTAKSDYGTLDPQVAAVLQKNLHVIDSAIEESRAAGAQEDLFAAMRSKVALLQQTVELINEMRKGNQTEAGRLLQGLNQ